MKIAIDVSVGSRGEKLIEDAGHEVVVVALHNAKSRR